MGVSSGDDWNQVKELFEAALDLKPPEREAFLAQNCADRQTREQVEKLICNYQEAGSFLNEPAFSQLGEARCVEESPDCRADAATLTTVSSMEIEDPMVGRRLGAYRLVRRLGKGGMGAVFLAVRADDEYQKEVAIKLVEPGPDSRAVLNRFRIERQTLAGLDHPNIVKLLDGGGTPEGLPFLVMDYVDGCPIDDYCDAQKLCVDERLRLFLQVCEAVQYAHQKSVVHRDLKPSNILVTSDGMPKLLDFGIAKVLNPQPSTPNIQLTQTGVRCMTPAYASPEQMRGNSITSASDIYSLGVVLYELLTGHRPYRLKQHTPAEVERAICEQEPETPSTAVSRVETDTSCGGIPVTKTPEVVSATREGHPEKLRRRLRGDLDNIVLKALHKKPDERYGSADEFAQDIQRHLQHLPVKARRSTLPYRASRLFKRHKIEVSAALIVIVMLGAAASVALNAFGLRDRVFGGAPITRIQPLKARRPAKPRGWVTLGAVDVRPAISCESLSGLSLPGTSITLAQSVPAGVLTPSGEQPIPNLPDFCRVAGVIKPTGDSDIQFEVWVPSSGWNGKFRGVGNGGFGGSINFGDMAAALRDGYATASTDTGHRANIADSTWALRHPEKVADWGYRSIHEMTMKAKGIVRAFYGRDPEWSFFEGASNGGREALMEAQRFPDDYQGILAGYPNNFWTHQAVAAFYNTQARGLTNTANYIPPSKIPAISAAVLGTCDALDGVTDGILNDPRQCNFDPSKLLCRGAESDSCLTSAQVAQLTRIYAGLRNSKGELLFPGYMPGGEEGSEGWKGWITGQAPGQSGVFVFSIGYFRNMVYEDPAWDYRTVSAESAARMADQKTAHALNATDTDLRRFQARGGKLILYHGWSDAAAPPLNTINYYEGVVGKLGLRETEAFVRLYMVPGMQHGYSGRGPKFFGQFDLSALGADPEQVSIDADPQHNIFSALAQWVETGTPPGPIIATKYVNDLDPRQGLMMTRPLCPYPRIATYKGSGDTNDAANFVCTQALDRPTFH